MTGREGDMSPCLFKSVVNKGKISESISEKWKRIISTFRKN
jgi:hypothetical protein